MNFLKPTVELQKENAVCNASYQILFQNPVLLPLLCWEWVTKIANLVYPQNQCNPEVIDETTGAPRL